MARGYFSPIDHLQGRLVREALVNMDHIAHILSDRSPSLTYKDNGNQCPTPSFIYYSAMLSPDDVPSSEGRPIGFEHQEEKLAGEKAKDTAYLNSIIEQCIDRYLDTIDNFCCLLQPDSRSASEESAAASAPAEEERVLASPSPPENEPEQSDSPSSRYATPAQPDSSPEAVNNRPSVVELNEPESPRTVTTIDFEDVYRGGTSATTHFILDYEHSLKTAPNVSGRWWILRCEQCDWHGLSERPGTFHMELHPELRIDDLESAIESFGVLVLNCTPDLANMNNVHVRKVMQDRASEPTTARARHKHKRRKVVKISVSPRSFTERQLISDPSVGEMYLAGWSDGKLYGAVALPLGDFMPKASIPGSMWDSGLLSSVPKCYRINKRARHFSWAEGFEDGGTRVGFRQFPLFYFDNPKVEDGHVGWAYAHDIHPFDLDKVTSDFPRPAALYANHYKLSDHTPFSHELFSHHQSQIKPVTEQTLSLKHSKGEKSSSASPTPQTTSTEADTDHDKKIVDGQRCTPSSDGSRHSFDPVFESQQPTEAAFDTHTYNSPVSIYGTFRRSITMEPGIRMPEAQMSPLGEPADEVIHQAVESSDCPPFAKIKAEPCDMLGETHDETPFADAMEHSVPTPDTCPQLINQDSVIQPDVDE
ncbi:unnamed protein product [Clonostachys byssicola]|uniref:Uncharacterized protein n=1 Tax=Clonostachys byssicola TaxID=160290 RepID=A0A9N9YDD8_9HYPO|nr:unnamed protein product [Clonostachys byssicola]